MSTKVVRATETEYQVIVTQHGPTHQVTYNCTDLGHMWRVVEREKAKPTTRRIRVMVQLAVFEITGS